MKNLKKIFLVLLMVLMIIPIAVYAEDEVTEKEPIKVYVFRSDTCPHCVETMEYLNSIKKDYGKYFEIADYEVSNQENSNLWSEVATFMGDSANGVPYMVVGKYTYPNGFDPDAVIDSEKNITMGGELIARIKEVYESDNRYDVIEKLNDKPDYSVAVAVIAGVIIVGLVGVTIITRRGN